MPVEPRPTRRSRALLPVLILAIALGACGESDPPAPAPDNSGGASWPAVDEDPGARPTPGPAGLVGDGTGPSPDEPAPVERRRSGFEPGGSVPDADLVRYHVEMEVAVDGESVGTMTLALWGDAAPITVRNFLRLCDVGFYDGLRFHRVLRNFMVQGGSPDGNGLGDSPFGRIPGEFSSDLERDHRYGVLSMARLGNDPDSASCQFFLCCDDSPPVWNLDGDYASFGRLVAGAEVLERLADTPVTPNRMGEVSVPSRELTIVRARPVLGPAPEPTEELRRPGVREEDVEVPRVVVESILVRAVTREGNRTVRRDPAQMAARAQELLALLEQEGASFATVAREHSEMIGADQDPNVSVLRLLHEGLHDKDSARAVRGKRRELEARLLEATERQRAGELTLREFQELSQTLNAEMQSFVRANLWWESGQVDPAVHAAAFTLQVGETRVVPWDQGLAPSGTWILRRKE